MMISEKILPNAASIFLARMCAPICKSIRMLQHKKNVILSNG